MLPVNGTEVTGYRFINMTMPGKLGEPRQLVIDDPFNQVQPGQPVLLAYAQADHHNHKDITAPQQFYLD